LCGWFAAEKWGKWICIPEIELAEDFLPLHSTAVHEYTISSSIEYAVFKVLSFVPYFHSLSIQVLLFLFYYEECNLIVKLNYEYDYKMESHKIERLGKCNMQSYFKFAFHLPVAFVWTH
jgi:hypothetical protein